YHRPAAFGAAHAVGGDIARHEVHRVVDHQRVVHHAAGAVDVQVDVLVALDALQVKHLHDQPAGGDVIDLADEEERAVLEEHFLEGHLAVAVVAALPRRAGHGHRHRDGPSAGNDHRPGVV